MRILAVADTRRSAALLGIPAIAEIGLPGMPSVTWYPAAAVTNKSEEDFRFLNRSINEALARPAMKERFTKLGLDPMLKSTAASASFIQQQHSSDKRWARDAKVTID